MVEESDIGYIQNVVNEWFFSTWKIFFLLPLSQNYVHGAINEHDSLY